MPKGIPINTHALPMLANIKIKPIKLSEEANHERIKRLAKKILRVVESSGGRQPATGDDLFSDATFEKKLAI